MSVKPKEEEAGDSLQSNNSSSCEPQLQKSSAGFLSGLILQIRCLDPFPSFPNTNHDTGATQPHK